MRNSGTKEHDRSHDILDLRHRVCVKTSEQIHAKLLHECTVGLNRVTKLDNIKIINTACACDNQTPFSSIQEKILENHMENL